MKTLKIIAIGGFLSLSHLHSGAQENLPVNQPDYHKPAIFNDLPPKINVVAPDLESLFDLSVGQTVIAKITKAFPFKGTVVSTSGSSSASLRSVVIRSSTRQGAVFTFSKLTHENGTVSYRGRIISRNSIDAYDLMQENGQYFLQKKNYYEMVSE